MRCCRCQCRYLWPLLRSLARRSWSHWWTCSFKNRVVPSRWNRHCDLRNACCSGNRPAGPDVYSGFASSGGTKHCGSADAFVLRWLYAVVFALITLTLVQRVSAFADRRCASTGREYSSVPFSSIGCVEQHRDSSKSACVLGLIARADSSLLVVINYVDPRHGIA